MSTLETLLLSQNEKQLSILQEQTHNFIDWLKNERKLIDKYISQHSFLNTNPSDSWEAASFYTIDGLSEIKGKWGSIEHLCLDEGLYLSNRIIRCKEPVTLKSLAVEVKLEAKLSINSEIWILTRGSGVSDPNSAILKISKESEIDGIFIVFGSPIGNDNDFVFFKRQQIPEEKSDPDQELTNIDIRIKDNGDDRIYVSIKLNTFQSAVFQTYCNKFIPSLIENQIMIAGYGRNVIIKGVSIQQKERCSMGIIIEGSKRQQCCNVF
ncbi:hypothetical protein SteCoe_19077 [Stentor coeruleus]|uniref:Uncharacterized protein n=1 Tax=Stentor coeruleus TaxID=5963 RepID=A0A1R2BUY6_9CILI|nr:hypothetical protein SteCoe_19077 [Stentor coeruleus]